MRVFLTIGLLVLPAIAAASAAERPNIVCVLFDDLGYGQFRALSPGSEFPMPHLEQLAREGMTFTDAHAAAAVCTPTRYGLLTGRYPSRIGQFGVLTTYSRPIIPRDRLTVAGMLQRCGYHTACIGKWHLGMVWRDGKPGRQNQVPIGSIVQQGPVETGFDKFYGFTHARNIGTVISQQQVVAHVEPVENQPLMIEEAVRYISERSQQPQPFFLYFPMCPPHKPIAPTPEYIGRSGAKDIVGKDPLYGDWILQGDAMLGRLMAALQECGLSQNTLIIAASDNGAERRAYAPLRESKRSIYEGGHRVPLVVHWPGKVAPAAECDETVCLNDIMATVAEITEFDLPADAAEDSVSLLPMLLGDSVAVDRNGIVHQSSKGDLAVRKGKWKLVFHKDGTRELFNLQADISETTDLSQQHAAVVNQLTSQMQQMIDAGRSTNGPPQSNDDNFQLMPSGN